uniref:Zinc finger, CCHC-type n=1 Tax=Heterorhabditis bacteriophora TaxID=37862 RepID=A0A1I7WGF8_HETBA
MSNPSPVDNQVDPTTTPINIMYRSSRPWDAFLRRALNKTLDNFKELPVLQKITGQLNVLQKGVAKILSILGEAADDEPCLFCKQQNRITEDCDFLRVTTMSSTSCSAQTPTAVAEKTTTKFCTTKAQGSTTAIQRNEEECNHRHDVLVDQIQLGLAPPKSAYDSWLTPNKS